MPTPVPLGPRPRSNQPHVVATPKKEEKVQADPIPEAQPVPEVKKEEPEQPTIVEESATPRDSQRPARKPRS